MYMKQILSVKHRTKEQISMENVILFLNYSDFSKMCNTLWCCMFKKKKINKKYKDIFWMIYSSTYSSISYLTYLIDLFSIDSELTTQYLQIIYIKFLNKLFTLNFTSYYNNNNNNNTGSNNPSGTSKLLSSSATSIEHNTLFLAQFQLIRQSLRGAQPPEMGN